MKVLVHHRASPGFEAALRTAAPAEVRLAFVDETDAETLRRELRDAQALLHILEPIGHGALDAAPELLLVQKIGVGVNTIDTELASELGIGVANMPGTNTQAVVEHTLALMLAALRRIVPLDAATRGGDGFPAADSLLDSTGEVSGRTVGLIGFGAVAARLAPVLVALGARVIVATRNASRVPGYPVVSVDDLVRTSDIVSLHVPLTPDTSGMLSKARIASMRPGAILVNTSRGGLVDQPALVEALRSGRLRGAALDVFADEPVAAHDLLFTLTNVVATPHIAWRTPETLARSFAIAFSNCERALAGRQLAHEIVPVRRGRRAHT